MEERRAGVVSTSVVVFPLLAVREKNTETSDEQIVRKVGTQALAT